MKNVLWLICCVFLVVGCRCGISPRIIRNPTELEIELSIESSDIFPSDNLTLVPAGKNDDLICEEYITFDDKLLMPIGEDSWIVPSGLLTKPGMYVLCVRNGTERSLCLHDMTITVGRYASAYHGGFSSQETIDIHLEQSLKAHKQPPWSCSACIEELDELNNCQCLIDGDSVLRLQFDPRERMLSAGEIVKFTPFREHFTTSNGVPFESVSLVLSALPQAMCPSFDAQILGKEVVSSCANVSLSVSFNSSAVYNPVTITWTINGTYGVELSNGNSSLLLYDIPKGNCFIVEVTLTDSYGCNATTSHSIRKQDVLMAKIVSLLGGTTKTVTYSKDIKIYGEVEVDSCVPDIPFAFVWRLFSLHGGEREIVLERNTTDVTLTLEPHSVPISQYEVRLGVSIGEEETRTWSQPYNLTVTATPLLSIIDHGNRVVTAASQTTLDASRSRDPDGSQTLDFSWNCSSPSSNNGSCLLDEYISNNTSVLILPPHSLIAGWKYSFSVSVGVEGKMTCSGIVTISAVQEEVTPVFISALEKMCVDSTEKFSLQGGVLDGGGNSSTIFSWKAISVDDYETVSLRGRTNVPVLVVEKNTLQEDTQYEFTITGHSLGKISGNSSIIFRTCSVPIQMSAVSVIPEFPSALEEFRVECGNWIDVDGNYPLTFSVSVSRYEGGELMPSSKSSVICDATEGSTISPAYLPAGKYEVMCSVENNIGGRSFGKMELEVPARDLNLLAVESTVETTISMLRNRGQSSMALPLIGSASDTINMLGNEDDEVIPFRRKMIVHIESLLSKVIRVQKVLARMYLGTLDHLCDTTFLIPSDMALNLLNITERVLGYVEDIDDDTAVYAVEFAASIAVRHKLLSDTDSSEIDVAYASMRLLENTGLFLARQLLRNELMFPVESHDYSLHVVGYRGLCDEVGNVELPFEYPDNNKTVVRLPILREIDAVGTCHVSVNAVNEYFFNQFSVWNVSTSLVAVSIFRDDVKITTSPVDSFLHSVEIEMKMDAHSQYNPSSTHCGWWDSSDEEFSGQGCAVKSFNQDTRVLTCSCNHTTIFAGLKPYDAVDSGQSGTLQLNPYAFLLFGLLCVAYPLILKAARVYDRHTDIVQSVVEAKYVRADNEKERIRRANKQRVSIGNDMTQWKRARRRVLSESFSQFDDSSNSLCESQSSASLFSECETPRRKSCRSLSTISSVSSGRRSSESNRRISRVYPEKPDDDNHHHTEENESSGENGDEKYFVNATDNFIPISLIRYGLGFLANSLGFDAAQLFEVDYPSMKHLKLRQSLPFHRFMTTVFMVHLREMHSWLGIVSRIPYDKYTGETRTVVLITTLLFSFLLAAVWFTLSSSNNILTALLCGAILPLISLCLSTPLHAGFSLILRRQAAMHDMQRFIRDLTRSSGFNFDDSSSLSYSVDDQSEGSDNGDESFIREEIRRLFEMCDTDGDGLCSEDDLKFGLELIRPGIGQDIAGSIFQEMARKEDNPLVVGFQSFFQVFKEFLAEIGFDEPVNSSLVEFVVKKMIGGHRKSKLRSNIICMEDEFRVSKKFQMLEKQLRPHRRIFFAGSVIGDLIMLAAILVFAVLVVPQLQQSKRTYFMAAMALVASICVVFSVKVAMLLLYLCAPIGIYVIYMPGGWDILLVALIEATLFLHIYSIFLLRSRRRFRQVTGTFLFIFCILVFVGIILLQVLFGTPIRICAIYSAMLGVLVILYILLLRMGIEWISTLLFAIFLGIISFFFWTQTPEWEGKPEKTTRVLWSMCISFIWMIVFVGMTVQKMRIKKVFSRVWKFRLWVACFLLQFCLFSGSLWLGVWLPVDVFGLYCLTIFSGAVLDVVVDCIRVFITLSLSEYGHAFVRFVGRVLWRNFGGEGLISVVCKKKPPVVKTWKTF